MNLLLNDIRDNEVAITSNVAYSELTAETYEFETTEDNQAVRFDIQIPFSVHQTVNGGQNGAFRIYLDGDGLYTEGIAAGKQWDGYLISNGGAWVSHAGIPSNGRVSCSFNMVIPNAGPHTLRAQYAGTTTYTIGTLRSRRSVQVVAL